MNDVILNWKKLKKFIKSERTDNETKGRDRGYTHEEIQKVLEFSDQKLKTHWRQFEIPLRIQNQYF